MQFNLEKSKDWADLALKIVTTAAIIIGGGWAYYQFVLGGADEWMVNLGIETRVLPYRGDLRLLEVHIKSKNPRNATSEFDKRNGTYTLTVREVPSDLKSHATIDANKGPVIAKIDLMPPDGYEFVPGAEFDDMGAVVVPAGSLVALSAEWTRKGDYVSIEKIVRVEP